jgi:DNA-binding MarR family transcriptional regulator
MGREVHPDLDPEAYGLLAGVHAHSWARASDLALHFGLGKATVSRQLKVLAQLELIDRESDPADGRAHVLVLTEEGRQRLERARTARRRRWHAMLGTWPVDDVRLMAGMLARFDQLFVGASDCPREGRQPLHPQEQPFGQEQLEPCPHEQLRIMPPACGPQARTARQTMVTLTPREVKPDRGHRSPRDPQERIR